MLAALGCKSEQPPAPAAKDHATPAVPGSVNIDLNCVMDRLQNPPEAFHYTYQKVSNNPVHEEADVTPQSIDGTFQIGADSATPVHGVRTDAAGWKNAWSSLRGIGGMAGTVALVRNGSAIAREGAEKVNGYDTIKYSIDTARATDADKSLFQRTLGPTGFERGTIWATVQGCPVKISLDVESHSNNGDTSKEHYEEAILKK
jgi:hypothetical protein